MMMMADLYAAFRFRYMVIRSQLEKTGYSLETGYHTDRLTVNFPTHQSYKKTKGG